MSGLRLLLLHPEVAARTCAECVEWHYDDAVGSFAPSRRTKLARGGALEMRRKQIGSKPMCFACPKQPADVPEADRCPATADERLSERNQQVFLHYKECSATLSFPSDPIVRRNAATIRLVEDHVTEMRRIRLGVL